MNPFLQPGRYYYHLDDYAPQENYRICCDFKYRTLPHGKLPPSWLRIECTSTISQELKSTINDVFPIDLNHHKSDPCVVVRPTKG